MADKTFGVKVSDEVYDKVKLAHEETNGSQQKIGLKKLYPYMK